MYLYTTCCTSFAVERFRCSTMVSLQADSFNCRLSISPRTQQCFIDGVFRAEDFADTIVTRLTHGVSSNSLLELFHFGIWTSSVDGHDQLVPEVVDEGSNFDYGGNRAASQTCRRKHWTKRRLRNACTNAFA
jgi:hypothetical protein